jgi:diguanylate cyclase (GGDEF)-like protein
MYGVIAVPDKEETIIGLISDIVYSCFGMFEQSELKKIFEMALRIPLNTLILDISVGRGNDLINALKLYRMQRPSTRIVLLAPGRVPGDDLVASFVHRGVFDIISEVDWPDRLKVVLDQPPADYSSAARWDVRLSGNDGNRGMGIGRLKKKPVKTDENTSAGDRENIESCSNFFSPVPQDVGGQKESPGGSEAVVCEQTGRSVKISIGFLFGVLRLIGKLKDKMKKPAIKTGGLVDKIHEKKEINKQQKEHYTGEDTEKQCIEDRHADLKDALTGCYTRQILQDYHPPENYVAVFIDLDRFKQVNDVFGHEAGDQVLAAFGMMLCSNLKGRDLAVRWGGDEFLLILPETSEKEALKVVENLRCEWEKHELDIGNLTVGFSAGISSGKGLKTLSEAVRVADREMYKVKNAGRVQNKDRRVGTIPPVIQPETFSPCIYGRYELPQKEMPVHVAGRVFKGLSAVVRVLVLLSLSILASDFSLSIFGMKNPALNTAAGIVKEFWKMMFIGLFG